jgi:nitrate/TMAO reductase-like tetraheme cytochrome c subunit
MMPKLMPGPMIPSSKRFLPAIFAITLLNLSILGCAQRSVVRNVNAPQIVNVSQDIYAPQDSRAPEKWNAPQRWSSQQKWNAQSDDCRSCHTSNGAAGAKDFSSIYANPKSHHPVGVQYPLATQADPNFQLQNGQSADVTFFDRNGNGRPDSDEVMLFGANGAETVECASCHKEHGSSPVSGNRHSDLHLRVANVGSALCMTCHRL